MKITFVSPVGYLFQGSNISTGNDRPQNLPGSKCFWFKNNQNWPRYRQKNEPGMAFRFVSIRGPHFRISNLRAGNDRSRLCPASSFFFFQYWQNLAIKSVFCPKWHIFGMILPAFGVHFAPPPTTYLILVREIKSKWRMWFPPPSRSWLRSKKKMVRIIIMIKNMNDEVMWK